MEHEKKSMSHRSKLVSGLLGCLLVVGVIAYSCSVEPKKQVVTNPSPTPPAPPAPPAPPPPPGGSNCPDGSTPGTQRTVACPAGQTGSDVQVCSQQGKWVDSNNTCTGNTPPPACTVPLYADVQPVFQQYCSSCHNFGTSFKDAQGAQGGPAEIARRVGLPPGDPQHMPQGNSPQLSPQQIQSIQTWVTDGANELCPPPGGGGTANVPFITEDYLTTVMNADALNIPSTDRPFIRYLVAGHAINNGAAPLNAGKFAGAAADAPSATNLQTWVQAANKALNSLANEATTLTPIQPVDPAVGAVWRLDLRNYGIGPNEVAAIEAGDTNINIVDNTSKGLALQALLGTKKPWFHLDNFIDVTFRNSGVYYAVTNTPNNLADLQKLLGVNFNQSLQQFAANFIGSANSPIAQRKNRLIVRTLQARDINNAYYWQTFDVNNLAGTINNLAGNLKANNDIVQVNSAVGLFAGQLIADAKKALAAGTTIKAVDLAKNLIQLSAPALANTNNDPLTVTPNKNLFQDPLLDGTGGQELFNADASEVIYQLQNGMQGYALFDNNGNLLNAAATNVVIDTLSPVSDAGAINNANSCTRCHQGGMIPMVDQILSSVTANASHFQANDVQLVKAFYQSPGSNAALFKADNAQFSKALRTLGIDPNQPDPQNVLTDSFLLNWSAKQAASFLFLTPDQFTSCLQSSATAQQQIGALLTPGGTVGFTQFTSVLQQLISDCNLFKDPVGNP